MRELVYVTEGRELHAEYFAEGPGAPLLIDIHGGGFCFGRAADDRALCARLARETGGCVASFDYCLAPRYRYPAAHEDCRALFEAVLADGALSFDRRRVYVMGHSAGANLAVALARTGRARGLVLNYPWLDLSQSRRKYFYASIPAFVLSSFAKKYCKARDVRAKSELSPVHLAAEEAAKLPPTLIITGGSDSLRTDGIAFYEVLRSAGADVRHVEYPAARHGFIEMAASGRMKPNFYTSKRAAETQLACFEAAVGEIVTFLKSNDGGTT